MIEFHLHNPNADDVNDCMGCLEILTNPKLKFANEIQAFAKADRAHFQALGW